MRAARRPMTTTTLTKHIQYTSTDIPIHTLRRQREGEDTHVHCVLYAYIAYIHTRIVVYRGAHTHDNRYTHSGTCTHT